ncbi:MAG: type IV secretory system conjugative DNA transfer family protein [Microthrixaceae bacterium]|nr:type IV secretory system conjugative DNA transfer family protein [Microthrixaceae bacterium]
MARERVEPPGAGLELVVVAAGAAAVLAGLVTAGGAWLAAWFSDGRVGGGLADWLRVTVRLARGESPTAAWGELATGFPSTGAYWACTAAVGLVSVAVATAAVVMWRRMSTPGRARFGQPLDARIAGRGDVTPLRVDELVPPTGRMLLGRHAGSGRVLATEDRERNALSGRAALRQGSRGSVALIGPTGSGKTALAASAVATWDGPAVVVSVKRDLYDVTVAARAEKGELAVFDPAASTGLPSARWSPLQRVGTAGEALRTGRALAQAIPRNGVTGADYWAKHGESLLGSFMCVAGLSQLVALDGADGAEPVNMQQIATWVSTVAMATDPVINALLRRGLEDDQPPRVQLMARHAASAFIGLSREDDRIRSSIYATARLAVEPWLEPSVAHSATTDPRQFYDLGDEWEQSPRFINLEWLMGGGDGRSNTLYLAAPQTEFERLSPVLGGLLAELKDSIHTWDIAGRKLSKPVLFLIDETGQLELGWLPGEVSTIAALGAFYVTCWQSLSQIQHRYASLADTVLGGHRSKVFFAGIDDAATLRYLHTVTGSEHVARRSWSADVWSGSGRGRRSISESQQREELVPNHLVRTMVPGEAVLLHGTLPPIHLRAVRWWTERRLRDLFPSTRPDVVTCPLTANAAEVSGPVLDASTLEFSRSRLPRPETGPVSPDATGRARTRQTNGNGQLTMDLETVASAETPDTVEPTAAVDDSASGAGLRAVNRVAGRCERCTDPIAPNAGSVRVLSNREVMVCWPKCAKEPGSGT